MGFGKMVGVGKDIKCPHCKLDATLSYGSDDRYKIPYHLHCDNCGLNLAAEDR